MKGEAAPACVKAHHVTRIPTDPRRAARDREKILHNGREFAFPAFKIKIIIAIIMMMIRGPAVRAAGAKVQEPVRGHVSVLFRYSVTGKTSFHHPESQPVQQRLMPAAAFTDWHQAAAACCIM